MNFILGVLAIALGAAGYGAQVLRWLRVAQREHYLPDVAIAFRFRWTRSQPINVAAEVASVVLVVAAYVLHRHHVALSFIAIMGVGILGLVEPRGLSIKGRTSKLALTTRMKRLCAVTLGCSLILIVIFGLMVSIPVALGVAIVSSAGAVDFALRILEPLERKSMQRFVDQAATTLKQVSPVVVAITGSYGKTSTKLHLTQLIAGARTVVATPASFNNRGGLARSINEHLSHGTEVFIAEMGTYGPGEIADLCAWIPPELAILTAIGPVHLERFGSLDVTLKAKAEITVSANTVVVNIDDPYLASLVPGLVGQGKTVIRCSVKDRDAEVALEIGSTGVAEVFHGGVAVGSLGVLAAGVQPINVALAFGAGQALGIDGQQLVQRAPLLGAAANRSTLATAESGVMVIDDTFNSNPTGAKAALATLRGLEANQRFVVTPGMIELGSLQHEANMEFARQAGEVSDFVVIVGRTNRKALLKGLEGTSCLVTCVDTRQDAVAFVRTRASARDAVLYENDLPDHYP